MHVDTSEPTSADHITIALADEPRGALRPLSIDLHVGALHAVFSARQAKTIDEIFQPDFARTVRDICLAVAPDTHIVNAPDFSIRIHGLGVEGYTLVCQTLEDGFRRFTIRLRRATGNPLAVLKLGADGEASSAAVGEMLREIDGRVGADRLFDGMLAHLYLPLVNLNSYLRTVLDGQRDCPGEQYSISAVQLRARTEILQYAFDRLIAELMVARAADGDEPAAGEALCAESQRITGAAPPEARFA